MSLTSEFQEGVESEDTADGQVEGEAAERSARTFICVVCQQPVAEAASQRWQGEPVHAECGAELRCGVAVGSQYDD